MGNGNKEQHIRQLGFPLISNHSLNIPLAGIMEEKLSQNSWKEVKYLGTNLQRFVFFENPMGL
ncbi:hypothetical protein R3X28_11985 [Maribacter sp. TH_r10]|uniref:hypothetical protein n=1 Tax=Maribacter sp. TH_r10 TaxID=3082086 RepID=UPI0029549DA7|nr:hypothetical protein [Maribacter sp. TH_r10]MDV7139603.1 hypothetical protein [Maribacter sp. TH_r10]